MNKIIGNISPTKKINGEALPSNSKVDGKIANKKKKISGNISPVGTINGNVLSKRKISGNITYGNGSSDPSAPVYYGEYEVTPLAFEQTVLNTSNKLMKKNVTVKEIPYYETSNLGGGVTVYIAGQVEFG
jgi:hypothetical protein